MNLLREYIREMLREQNVLAIGMCFPFAAKKAEEWFDQHFEAHQGRAPKRHPDLNNMSKFKVVHGKITDQWKKPPKPIVHAWVEMGDLVFDDQTKITKPDGVPKDVYYDMYQPEVVKEYNAEEVVVNCIMKGEGPWDEGLVDTMKRRDAWLTEQMGQQPVGYGKNYHTVNPKPITWENYEGLNYSISAEGDGSYYAQIEVIDYPELSTPMRKFSDEHSAQWWVRDNYEKLHRLLLAKTSRV